MVWAVSVMVVVGNAALPAWMGHYGRWAAIGLAAAAATIAVTKAVSLVAMSRQEVDDPVAVRRLGVHRLDTDARYCEECTLALLIGCDVTEVWVSEDRVTFTTNTGPVSFEVYGDCCSTSYFHDIVGVEKLLANGPVTGFQENHDELKVYGYAIVTEHPLWGEQTTVLSFRNDSNGYYGGEMVYVEGGVQRGQRKVTGDWVVDENEVLSGSYPDGEDDL